MRDDVRRSAPEADGRVHADSANNYALSHGLSQGTPTTPWYIHLAGLDGLFWRLCFDFDGKDSAGHASSQLVDEAVDQADVLARLLEQFEIPYVLCESSSSGGRHIWVALSEGAPADVVRALGKAASASLPQLDWGMLANPKEGGARPPLSPHRNGSYSRVLYGDLAVLKHPTTTLEQLQRLVDQLQAQVPPERNEWRPANGPAISSHESHRELAPWGARHMATAGGGSNPSQTGFLCLIAAAAAGWEFSDVVRAAETAPGMEHYRSRNNGRGRRKPRTRAQMQARLESQWPKAQANAALHAPQTPRRTREGLGELPELVDDVQAILASFDRDPQRWGSTLGRVRERSTIATVAYLTLVTGKRTVAASVRDLGLIAGGGKSGAAQALTRLAEDGLTSQAQSHTGRNASEWRLAPHRDAGSDTTRTQPLTNTRPPGELYADRRVLLNRLEQELTDRRHDLFSYEGLGYYAGLVYSFLQERRGYTVSQLVLKTGLKHRHVVTSLSRLRNHRLIVHASNGWARSLRDGRTRIARKLGVNGVLVARARTYQVDRDLWAWWQAEYATMHTSPRFRPRRPHVSSRPLFDATNAPDRLWPRYPRTADGLGDHQKARQHVRDGHLEPTSRIQLAA